MSVGYPASKSDIDNRAGSLAVAVRDDFSKVRLFKAFLDSHTDQNLIDLAYVQADINTLRSAYADLDKLAQIYGNLATQATTYDFQTFAKLLTGVL